MSANVPRSRRGKKKPKKKKKKKIKKNKQYTFDCHACVHLIDGIQLTSAMTKLENGQAPFPYALIW